MYYEPWMVLTLTPALVYQILTNLKQVKINQNIRGTNYLLNSVVEMYRKGQKEFFAQFDAAPFTRVTTRHCL